MAGLSFISNVVSWVKQVFKPRFTNLEYARKQCSRCGAIFSLYQMSNGDSHHFYGPTWYEPALLPEAAANCDCVRIMARGKPRGAV